MDLPKSSGGCQSVDEKGIIDEVMTVGSKRQFISKKIEVGFFDPSVFNKGKSLEDIEMELAIEESIEFDERNRLKRGEDSEVLVSSVGGGCSSSSSTIVTSNHVVDLIQVMLCDLALTFYVYIDLYHFFF